MTVPGREFGPALSFPHRRGGRRRNRLPARPLGYPQKQNVAVAAELGCCSSQWCGGDRACRTSLSRTLRRAQSEQPDHAWLLGGRYRVLDRLGLGGMAEVFRAHDDLLDRDVAVKVFRTVVAGDDDTHGAVRRELELQSLARLNHPNLITLYDGSVAGEGPAYLVLELVNGPDLASRLREGPLPEPEARELGAQIADALAYVHARGMVHRDVKPANILLGIDEAAPGTVRSRLSDFGIVRMIGSERMTSVDMTLGTASYVAPEQAKGANVGPAADVYALALVLIESLTGVRCFDGPVHEALAARLTTAPQIPPGLPAPWPELLGGHDRAGPRRPPLGRRGRPQPAPRRRAGDQPGRRRAGRDVTDRCQRDRRCCRPGRRGRDAGRCRRCHAGGSGRLGHRAPEPSRWRPPARWRRWPPAACPSPRPARCRSRPARCRLPPRRPPARHLRRSRTPRGTTSRTRAMPAVVGTASRWRWPRSRSSRSWPARVCCCSATRPAHRPTPRRRRPRPRNRVRRIARRRTRRRPRRRRSPPPRTPGSSKSHSASHSATRTSAAPTSSAPRASSAPRTTASSSAASSSTTTQPPPSSAPSPSDTAAAAGAVGSPMPTH